MFNFLEETEKQIRKIRKAEITIVRVNEESIKNPTKINLSKAVIFPIERIESGFASATFGLRRTLIGKVAHSSDPKVRNLSETS